ncbi:MAG: hypothetical protein CME34_19725 [Gordonia sp.]|uniref:SMI1/KNR4 family protein n=1 Tax=Gordonia sp. (in: high G+C Gram-positive bacteria) TaxID=84139 RepID=UPI000C4B061A|nr:SMI1/KNR4 family protein [Gordonia sp. (in: high G+C Gram-positive bacteria)]MAU84055.1 hypothetical protein [Gordonia sp. (in: high G+C Gram-positive bacteria)]
MLGTADEDIGVQFALILEFYAKYAPNMRARFRPPATGADFSRYEEFFGESFPDDLAPVMKLANGCPRDGDFFLHQLLGVDEVIETRRGMELMRRHYAGMVNGDYPLIVSLKPSIVSARYWSDGWIPFTATDGDGGLALDLSPEIDGRTGQVVNYGLDENWRACVAPTVAGLLARINELITAGRFLIDPESNRVSFFSQSDDNDLLLALIET